MSEKNDKVEEKKDETPEPRWDVINELYNGFDEVLHGREDDKMLTFFEIQSSILMLTEKVNQEKLNMYMSYLNSEHEGTKPPNMYK